MCLGSCFCCCLALLGCDLGGELLVFFLFGKSHKTPAEIAHRLKNALSTLERKDAKKEEKALEEVVKWLQVYDKILYGTNGEDTDPAQVSALAQETYYTNVLLLLVRNLHKFDFETKKLVASISNHLIRRRIGARYPTVEYLSARYDIIFALLKGYENPDIALTCGRILRSFVRHEDLAKVVLQSSLFYNFFAYVEVSIFDVASDAFATFRELVTRHRQLCARFIEDNYEHFFGHYRKLLVSENYVTRRQSIKLLGELLLDRQNYDIMTRFISDMENLKMIMNMLKEKSRGIQFEAFHVFKIFVANPNKAQPIAEILIRNKEKLVKFLSEFQNDRVNDQQFMEEKAFMAKQIEEMQPT